MIKPTVGRVLWFHAGGDHDTTRAAIVAAVNDDGTVNLATFESTGSVHPQISVPLIQDGAERPGPGAGWCEWMPYQIGQAAKAEESAKQADSPTENNQG